MVWGQEWGSGCRDRTPAREQNEAGAGSAWNTNAVKQLEFQVLPLEPVGVGPESRRRPLRTEVQSFHTSGPLSAWCLFGAKGSWPWEMEGYVKWWEKNFRKSAESLATAHSEVKSKS